MPSFTSRRNLPVPIGTDSPSEYRIAGTALANAVDNDVFLTSGSLATRPSSGQVLGQTYFATDTGNWYFWNGTAWGTVNLLAGSWTNVTLPSGWLASSVLAHGPWRYRVEGDTVRVTGGLGNYTGASQQVVMDGNTTFFPVIPNYTVVLAAQIVYSAPNSSTYTITATSVTIQGNADSNPGQVYVADPVPTGSWPASPFSDLLMNGTFPIN